MNPNMTPAGGRKFGTAMFLFELKSSFDPKIQEDVVLNLEILQPDEWRTDHGKVYEEAEEYIESIKSELS